MPKSSNKKIEATADKIQNNIEKNYKKSEQVDYKKKQPVFIWYLRLMLIISIIESALFLLIITIICIAWGMGAIKAFDAQLPTIGNIIFIPFAFFMLHGLKKRKRWVWVVWVAVSLMGVGLVFLTIKGILTSMLSLVMLVLLLMHKDYFNK